MARPRLTLAGRSSAPSITASSARRAMSSSMREGISALAEELVVWTIPAAAPPGVPTCPECYE